ncbi:MAG: hypothetical protein LBI16_02900, partial [Burkholderiales bacterium]|nr:hypothetical protein [Burkholderiales bacterium]
MLFWLLYGDTPMTLRDQQAKQTPPFPTACVPAKNISEPTSALVGEIEQVLLARLPSLIKAPPPRRIACLGDVPPTLQARYPNAAWVNVADGADADLIWGAFVGAASFTPYTPAVFRDINNALADNGVFLLATLGPQTLLPLQPLCSPATTPHAFASWPTLVELGNALVAAGLAKPVLDCETLMFTYASAADALAELARDGWFDASSCAQDATQALTAADGSA